MSTDDHPLPVLMSYAYLREESTERVHNILSDPRCEFLIDSGAFSSLNADKPIDLDAYMAFLERHDDHIWNAIQLDELGDSEQSNRNLRRMLDRGLEPVPVHVWGDGPDRMDELFEVSDYVAFGGLRRPGRGWGPKSYVKQKMEWADGRPVHWLGYTNMKMVTAYRPRSVDSSNATVASRWGECYLYLGKGRNKKVLSPDKRRNRGKGQGVAPLTGEMQQVIERLGYDESDWYDERKWRNTGGVDGLESTDFISREVTWNSFIRMSLDMRDTLGTRYFLASGVDDYRIIDRHLAHEGFTR